ncbi:MAG TPA: radical SAM protein, partial [Nostocaceae cyanobacterium]|nr:radical SAM protein [Nostocaceae cyanobacterium]
YGLDLAPPCSLQELIEEILRQKRLQRLRIGSVDPNEFGDSLLELCRRSPEICRHFHIPLQSGSDGVLARMGRPYDTAAYRLLLDKIDSAMPDAFIGTDLIAGFPGETEAEFADTCRLIESLPLADLHVFPYSLPPAPCLLPPASFTYARTTRS